MEKQKVEVLDDGQKKKEIALILFAGCIFTTLAFFLDRFVLYSMGIMQNDLLSMIFKTITFFGEIEIFPSIAIIITIFLLVYRKKIFGFWLSVISSFVLGFFLKLIIGRPRPFEFLHVQSIVSTSLSSFPSGHTIAFFCILPFMNHYFPKGKIWFWIIALLVGFSRIYLQVHYLSDVVAGAFIGYAIGCSSLYLGEKYGWK